MFYLGIGPTPTPIPVDYTLGGCNTHSTVPTSYIEVGNITLCDITYSINDAFDSQEEFINFLNSEFLTSFGLLGSFYIDEENHLVYVTSNDCSDTNCIDLLSAEYVVLLSPDGTKWKMRVGNDGYFIQPGEVTTEDAVPYIVFGSPDSTRWKLKVGDDGYFIQPGDTTTEPGIPYMVFIAPDGSKWKLKYGNDGYFTEPGEFVS